METRSPSETFFHREGNIIFFSETQSPVSSTFFSQISSFILKDKELLLLARLSLGLEGLGRCRRGLMIGVERWRGREREKEGEKKVSTTVTPADSEI